MKDYAFRFMPTPFIRRSSLRNVLFVKVRYRACLSPLQCAVPSGNVYDDGNRNYLRRTQARMFVFTAVSFEIKN